MSKYDDIGEWKVDSMVRGTFNSLQQNTEHLFEDADNFMAMLSHLAMRAFKEGYDKALQHYEPAILDSSQLIQKDSN